MPLLPVLAASLVGVAMSDACHPLDGRTFKIFVIGDKWDNQNKWLSFQDDGHYLRAVYSRKTEAMPLLFKAANTWQCHTYKLQNKWINDDQWVSFRDCGQWLRAVYSESDAMPIYFKDIGGSRYKMENKWPGQDRWLSFTGYYNKKDCGRTFKSGSVRAVYGEDGGMYVTLHEEPYSHVRLLRQVLRSMQYPGLDGLPPVAPTSVDSRVYCNAAGFPHPTESSTSTESVESGTSSCFSWDTSMTGGGSIGTEAEVKGGIPLIADASATVKTNLHWEYTAGMGGENCDTSKVRSGKTLKFPSVTLPPYTSEVVTFSQFQGKIDNLKFTALLDQYFSDGTSKTKEITGTYKGVQYSKTSYNIDHYKENVHSCSSYLAEIAAEFGNISMSTNEELEHRPSVKELMSQSVPAVGIVLAMAMVVAISTCKRMSAKSNPMTTSLIASEA